MIDLTFVSIRTCPKSFPKRINLIQLVVTFKIYDSKPHFRYNISLPSLTWVKKHPQHELRDEKKIVISLLTISANEIEWFVRRMSAQNDDNGSQINRNEDKTTSLKEGSFDEGNKLNKNILIRIKVRINDSFGDKWINVNRQISSNNLIRLITAIFSPQTVHSFQN